MFLTDLNECHINSFLNLYDCHLMLRKLGTFMLWQISQVYGKDGWWYSSECTFFLLLFFTYMAVICHGVPLSVDFEMKKWDKQ